MTRRLLTLLGARVLIVAVAVVLLTRDRLPAWLVALVVLCELASGLLLLLCRLRGVRDLDAEPVAPTAAGLLLVGLVLAGVAHGDGSAAALARVFGWAATWWGVGLSWLTVTGRGLDLRHLLSRDGRQVLRRG